MPQDPTDPLSRSMIGRSALRRGILSEGELAEYRRAAGEEGGTLSLIEYLLEHKGLTPEQVADLLRSKAAEGSSENVDPVPERGGGFAAPAHGTGHALESGVSTGDEPILIEPVNAENAERGPAKIAETVRPAEVSAGDEPVSIEPANADRVEKFVESMETTRRTAPPRPVSPPFSAASAPPAPSATSPAPHRAREGSGPGPAPYRAREGSGPGPAPHRADSSTVAPAGAKADAQPAKEKGSGAEPAPSFSAISAPLAPSAPSAPSTRLQFGYLAVRLGYVTPEQLAVALDTQQFLQKRRQPSRIGEILVMQGVLSARQILALLRLQGKTLLRCAGCKARFNAERYDPAARPVVCRRCGGALTPAGPGDIADAPSAQGTFTNLPAAQAASTLRPSASTLSAVPEETIPSGPLARPASRSRLAAVPPVSNAEPRPAPAGPSATAGRPQAVPPSGAGAAPAGASERLSVGVSERPGVPRSDSQMLRRSDAQTSASAPGYVYKEYASTAESDKIPPWFWPACAAGVLVTVLAAWLLSLSGGETAPERPSVGEPERLSVRTSERRSVGTSHPPTLPPSHAPTLSPSDPPILKPTNVTPPPTVQPAPAEVPAVSVPRAADAVVTAEGLPAGPDAVEPPAPVDPARAIARLKRTFQDPPRKEIQLLSYAVLSGNGGVLRILGRLPEGTPDRTAILLLVYPEFERENEGQFLHLRAATQQGVFEKEMTDFPPGSYRVTAQLNEAQPAEAGARIKPEMRAWRGEMRMIAGSPEQLGDEILRRTADLLPSVAAFRRGWPGLIDLHRRTAAGENPSQAWSEWKSRNPLGPARATLARIEESPESGRIVPRTAAVAADLATALDAMYTGVARKAGESAPAPFRSSGARTVDPPEEVLRTLPETFAQAIVDDALRTFRAAIGQIAETVEQPSDGATTDPSRRSPEGAKADLAEIRKTAGTIEARFEELIRMDGWPQGAPATGLTDAFRVLRALLDAVERDRSKAPALLRDLRQRLEEPTPAGTR